MKYAIKHRYTDVVLYEADIPADTPSGMQCRAALEKATQAKVNLSYSDLSGSDLRGSNLSYSNLRGSNLSGSDLRYSDLSGSNLSGSDLSYSKLSYSNLSGSNLSYSDLSGSNLSGSDLSYSDLRGSNLSGSDLSYSDLSGSDLSGSNLRGSDLSYSDLSGAIVRHQKLIGARPFFHIGPIGSRCAQFVSYITEAGLLLNAGCFWGTVDEFRAKLADEHGDNDHAKEYEMALLMIEAHAAIWTPKEEA